MAIGCKQKEHESFVLALKMIAIPSESALLKTQCAHTTVLTSEESVATKNLNTLQVDLQMVAAIIRKASP